MATIVITGGTGLIGTALTNALVQRGDSVIVLTRAASEKQSARGISLAHWDPIKGTIDADALQKADYIVHLAGANVGEGRWTPKRKKEIRDSRVLSGALLVKTLKERPNQVKAVISASATGWYGSDRAGSKPFVETDPPAEDFLGRTCQEWEASMQPVAVSGKRLVILRTGIVLSKDGGAYPEFGKTLPMGVASVLGDGTQVVSWIHIDDMVQIYLKAIDDERMSGVFNAVAPQPASNREIILSIAKASGKFYVPVPVPAFALKLVVGEMSVEVLKSVTVSSAKVEGAGYAFKFPDIVSAVKDLGGS
jgi:hypothetical protein